jgi:hypothetical protein
MSDDPTGPRSPDDAEQGSVFGKLPGSRPGTRSPRRASATTGKRAKSGPKQARTAKPRARTAKPAAARSAAKATAARTAAKPARPRAAPRSEAEPPDERTRGRPEPAEREGGGLEEIAWAGVAAAAEAATIGVRLASRAIEALRGNSERG